MAWLAEAGVPRAIVEKTICMGGHPYVNPEPGDRSILVTREDVSVALRAVGVVPGDTAMLHSALSSMGTVVGGPDTLVDGFRDAVGPDGTVAVPTLCNWVDGEQHLVFERWNPASTPCYVGAIPEAFWRRREAVRSDHATHSVAAIGARGVELTANHGSTGPRPGPFGPAAFARESPWERLYQWNAAYCFVGVTFRVNTMVHYVESLVVERALERAAPAERPGLAAEVVGWRRPGVWSSIRIEDREVAECLMAEQGTVRYGRIGSATLRCARARPMVDQWLAILEAEPGRWFPPTFLEWLSRIPRRQRD